MSTNTVENDQSHFTSDGPCPVCGFRPDTVPPGDAAVALRSFPRRFRQALSSLEGDDERLAHRPEPGSWSALEHAGHVRDALHAIGLRLHRVLREDHPALADTPDTPPASIDGQGAELVLSGLQRAVDDLVAIIEQVTGDEWLRAGERNGSEVRIIDLVREAVHEGAHHLRSTQRALAEVTR